MAKSDHTSGAPEQPTGSVESIQQPPKKRRWKIFTFVGFMHVLGALTAIHAVMSTRTSQGAIAWAIGSVSCPYIAVPAYWVFGRSKFDGYELLRRKEVLVKHEAAHNAERVLKSEGMVLEPRSPEEATHLTLLQNLSGLPITKENRVELLIDGKQTFDTILQDIDAAQSYVLFQFYMVRDDGLGRSIKEALIRKAKQGVRVYFLYDELGSNALPKSYSEELRSAGAEIFPFNTTQGGGNRFQLNFRNHRKIVAVDGKVAHVGGHNVGDEYLGKDPVLTPWRDTHVKLQGPVVQCIQVPFLEDWKWATGKTPELNWIPEKAHGGETAVACLPTGPADKLETGTLWFLHAINSAKKRLWIVTPYFVPDPQIMSALQLASLKGVDVRILIPMNPDHTLVYLSAKSYLQEAEDAGVKIFRFEPGFLHQKLMLVDDHTAAVGTHNLDNRSMRLNFEITMLMFGREFASRVEKMLMDDFANSSQASAKEYTEASLLDQFLIRASRLTAPVQ